MGYAPFIKINTRIDKPLNELMRETFDKLKNEAMAHPEQIPIIVHKNN